MEEKKIETVLKEEENGGSTTSAMKMDSNGSKESRRRPRLKSYFKEVIQKIESLFLGRKYRRPAWLKELAAGNDDQWFPVEAIVSQLTSGDGKCTGNIGTSKGFMVLLRESNLLEVDADGSKVRAKAEEDAQGVTNRSNCILYVDNLPGRADDDWLSKAFSPYGRLIDAWVIKPRNKAAIKARQREEEERQSGKTKLTPNGHRKNKGFGFVHFAEPSTVQQLLNRFRGGNIGQASLSKVRKTKSREQKTSSPTGSTSQQQPAVSKSSNSNMVLQMSSASVPSTSKIPEQASASAASESKQKEAGHENVPSTTDITDGTSLHSTSKRKNTGHVEAEEPATKRSRNSAEADSGHASATLCNGHADSDCDFSSDRPVEPETPTFAPKKRKRRKRKPQARHEIERQNLHKRATNDNVISSLRIYAWSEWHACKKAYLEKQKESYSNLKSELKQLKSEGKVADSLLKRKDRFRDGKKELRGREKIALKAEAAIERRNQSATTEMHNDQT